MSTNALQIGLSGCKRREIKKLVGNEVDNGESITAAQMIDHKRLLNTSCQTWSFNMANKKREYDSIIDNILDEREPDYKTWI